MAKSLDQFIDETDIKPQFSAKPWYNESGDCVHFCFEEGQSFAERVDERLTVYRANTSGKIVGFQIKGIRALLRKLGNFGLAVKRSEINLFQLFVLSHYEAVESEYQPKRRHKFYQSVIERAGRIKVKLPAGWEEMADEEKPEVVTA